MDELRLRWEKINGRKTHCTATGASGAVYVIDLAVDSTPGRLIESFTLSADGIINERVFSSMSFARHNAEELEAAAILEVDTRSKENGRR